VARTLQGTPRLDESGPNRDENQVGGGSRLTAFVSKQNNNQRNHSMKKYIVMTCAVFGLVTASFAQSSATLTISGSVAPINTITIASQTGYNALDLVNGQTAKLVGIATETSNDSLGYKVTLASANAGATAQAFLRGALGGNTDTVNYSIQYGGSAVTLSSGSALVTSATGRTGASGVTKNINVTFAGSWLAADTYSDTLTLTIAGN
jgi:hypothetical protein